VGEALGSARANPNSAASATASFNPNEIVADALKLFFDALRSGASDTDYTDERSNAHNDAEHRQCASHAIPKQRSQGFPKNRVEKHVDL
jgi:hypothetical protein